MYIRKKKEFIKHVKYVLHSGKFKGRGVKTFITYRMDCKKREECIF